MGLAYSANGFELGEKDCRVGVCWFQLITVHPVLSDDKPSQERKPILCSQMSACGSGQTSKSAQHTLRQYSHS